MEELLNEQRNILLNIADEEEKKGIANKEDIELLKTKNIELDTTTLIKILQPIGYTLRVVPLTEKIINNAKYLNKIDKSLKQLEEGKVVVKTMEELEEMTKETIKERFENYNGDYKPKEIDWGKPVGKEKI